MIARKDMTRGTERIYPIGRNKEFGSNFQLIGPEEGRSLQWQKRHEYDNRDSGNVNRTMKIVQIALEFKQ